MNSATKKTLVKYVSRLLSGVNAGRTVVGYGRRQEKWFDSHEEAMAFVESLGGMP